MDSAIKVTSPGNHYRFVPRGGQKTGLLAREMKVMDVVQDEIEQVSKDGIYLYVLQKHGMYMYQIRIYV